MSNNKLTSFLTDEMNAKRKGGLYDRTNVQFALQSNLIEGVDDIIETANHFVAFDSSVLPFVIDNEHKMYYYRGLSEFAHTPGFLLGSMQSAQDTYEAWVRYFNAELLEGQKKD